MSRIIPLTPEQILHNLLDTIEETGGLLVDPTKDRVVPAGDPDWLDLGKVVEQAEIALGRKASRFYFNYDYD